MRANTLGALAAMLIVNPAPSQVTQSRERLLFHTHHWPCERHATGRRDPQFLFRRE
jgi:hypothetical protein